MPLAQPKALVSAEEEQLVVNDRPSPVDAKLILGKGRTLYAISVVEEIVCVQHLVANELVKRTVVLVRARFGREVDNSAGKPAIFRTQVVGLDFEFLDGVLRWNHGYNVQIRAVRGYPVNQNLALTSHPPAHLEISQRERIGAHRAARRGVPSRGLSLRNDARHQFRQGNRVAAIEGQVGDSSLFDHLPQGVRLRLQ